MSRDELTRIRYGILAVFFAMGFAVSATATRLADIKETLNVGDAVFGYALVAGTIGGITGNTFAHRFIHRHGSKLVAKVAGVSMMSFVASNGYVTTPLQLAATSFGTALTYSTINVAMNTQGVDLEYHIKKSIMPSFHAAWSIGSLLTAIIGTAVGAVFSPSIHLTTVAALAIAMLLIFSQFISTHDDVDDSHTSHHEPMPAEAKRKISLIALALALGSIAEGSVFDWSSVYMHEFLGIGLGLNALGVTAFFICQIIGRTLSGPLIDRFGVYRVVRNFALVSSVGYAISLLLIWWLKTSENSVNSRVLLTLSCVAFGLVAIGAAAMPASFVRAAGRVDGIPTARGISAVSVRNSALGVAFRFVVSTIAGTLGLTAALLATAISLFASALLSRVVRNDD